MRVLILLKTNEGGAWIMPQIDSLESRNHEVTVCLPPGRGRLRDALDRSHVQVIESPFTFKFAPTLATIQGLLRLRRAIVSFGPDVILYHLYASALAARISTLFLPSRRVHMVAGPLHLDSGIISFVESYLLGLDDVLIAGSRYTLNRYQALKGPRPPTIEYVPYGVDTTRFIPASASQRRLARRDLLIDPSQFAAVMVAYIYAPKPLAGYEVGIKGHEILVEAWRIFARDKDDVRLFMVGGGFDAAGEAYRQNLMGRQNHQDITWTGRVKDVRPYYFAADVSVSPSLSENHGAALEAGACAIPSIVSDAGGLPETVTTLCGWIFPKGDVASLVQRLESAYIEFHANKLASRSQDARRHVVENFDSTAAAAKVADLVEATLGRGAKKFTVFSEARLALASGGHVALDGVNGDSQWRRYRNVGGSVEVAARVWDDPTAAGEPLTATVVVPLPAYSGVSGAIVTLPALCAAVYRAVCKSDVVILKAPGLIPCLAAAAAWWARKPYVVEFVGDPREVLRSGAVPGGWHLSRAAALIFRRVARGAAAGRYVTRKTLQTAYPLRKGAPAFSIPDGPIPAEWYVAEGRPWESMENKSSPLKLLCVGSQATRYKGHDVAIRALKSLREGGLDARLELVGDGSEQAALRSLAGSLSLTEAVIFRGTLTREGVAAAMKRADILLHPSRTEGLPRVVVEAMASGLPVVATPVGGIVELLREEDLVPVDDSVALAERVLSIAESPSQYTKASAWNLAAARPFSAHIIDAEFDRWMSFVRALAWPPPTVKAPNPAGKSVTCRRARAHIPVSAPG